MTCKPVQQLAIQVMDRINALAGVITNADVSVTDTDTHPGYSRDADRILPITASEQRTGELIKGARLFVVNDGPHCITWTHSEEVNRELVDFLGKGIASTQPQPPEGKPSRSRPFFKLLRSPEPENLGHVHHQPLSSNRFCKAKDEALGGWSLALIGIASGQDTSRTTETRSEAFSMRPCKENKTKTKQKTNQTNDNMIGSIK